MSHLGQIEPQFSSNLSQYVVYTWAATGAVDNTGTLRFTTAAHLGLFIVTDVWIYGLDVTATGGLTFSLGTAASLYNQIVNGQTTGTIAGAQFVGPIATVATASANGPAVPPSTGVYSRVPSSTLSGSYQVFVGGFYTGARG